MNCSEGVLPYVAYNIEDLASKLEKMSKKTKEDLNIMGSKNKLAVQTVLSEKEMAIQFEKICNQLL